MRAGVRYVRHAPALRNVVVRTPAFVAFASALWALLPLVVRTGLGAPVSYGRLSEVSAWGLLGAALLRPGGGALVDPYDGGREQRFAADVCSRMDQQLRPLIAVMVLAGAGC